MPLSLLLIFFVLTSGCVSSSSDANRYFDTAHAVPVTLNAEDFASGTLSSADGQYSKRDNRIYTPGYYVADSTVIQHTSTDTMYIVMSYDYWGDFLGTSGWIYDIGNYESEYADTVYYRFVLAYKNGQQITEENKEPLCETLTVTSEKAILTDEILTELRKDIVVPGGYEIVISPGLQLTDGSYLSDMTWVNGELWVFPVSDDAHEEYVTGFRYAVDFQKKEVKLLGVFKHNLGHCNTVDYHEENDCLIVGSGGAYYTHENYFQVIPDVYNKVSSARILDVRDAIKYDCDKLPGKNVKLNACWGDEDGEVILITNNNGKIYQVLLDEHSAGNTGDFTILQSFEQDDVSTITESNVTFSGMAQEFCNQGSDYSQGVLYTGVWHNGLHYWKHTFADGVRREVTNESLTYHYSGKTAVLAVEGIAVCEGWMAVGLGENIYLIEGQRS